MSKENRENCCTKDPKKYEVYQDVVELHCGTCGYELEFICLGDIESQTALEMIFDIMKEYEA
jgi:hypothetical protein